ncbi:hypothetical protein AGMMS50225_09020 [Betaproteobacteria bacterium]|nr:hypothetical protein AGMMS50225_09020 [Betaproteobacteria bacterium]
MMSWIERSIEERNLLNPSFCAMLLWHVAQGYAAKRSILISIELSFLVLPFVLHKETRENLPTNIRTSLSAWLTKYPIVRTQLGERAATLCAFTKEALIFGGTNKLFALTQDGIRANAAADIKRQVNTALRLTSDEVRDCAKRAEFLGRWLENAGEPETVMILLGVRP